MPLDLKKSVISEVLPCHLQKRVVMFVNRCGEMSTSRTSNDLSRPVTTNSPIAIKNSPRVCLIALLVADIPPRQRNRNSRDIAPSSTSGNPAPRPKVSIVKATAPRFLPCAAKTDAAPSVGPTRGSMPPREGDLRRTDHPALTSKSGQNSGRPSH